MIVTPIHPRWLRCSCSKYRRVPSSLRLASGAPRRHNRSTYFPPDP